MRLKYCIELCKENTFHGEDAFDLLQLKGQLDVLLDLACLPETPYEERDQD
jgi:hypothetical protein